MNLPKITDLELTGKKVILRLDLDCDPKPNDLRIKVSSEIIKYLIEHQAKTIVISHKGRPNGKIDNQFSLKSTSDILSNIINKPIKFVYDLAGVEAKEESNSLQNGEVMMLENLRFDSREEANDQAFAKSLAELGEIYINEAFASSHREHTSIVSLPKLLPHAAGNRFVKEIENLSKVFDNPERPLVFLISGLKEDKLPYVKIFSEIADKVLVGGRLPDFMGDEQLVSVRLRKEDEKIIVGNLIMDKEDITLNTIDFFEKEISKAKTVVVSGPLGKFEDEGHRQGTERVLNAVAKSNSFKIAGGGDTEAAIDLFSLANKFDWISVGGGAMLDFLSKKTLPGIEALKT